MRIGFVGHGFIARTHAKVLKEMGHDLVVVIGRDKDRVNSFGEEFGFKVASTSLEDLFNEDLDCVHVLTPANLHTNVIQECLERGIRVFAEKPLCLRVDEAKEIVELEKKSGLACGVGFNVRYHEGVNRLKEEVKKMGKVNFFTEKYLQEFNVMPCPYDWRYDEEMAGKMRAVTEIGSHAMDLLEYVLGKKIKRVRAEFIYENRYRKLKDGFLYPGSEEDHDLMVNSEDAAIIQVEMEEGILGTITLSEISPGYTNSLSLEIVGEKSVSFNSEYVNEMVVGSKGEGRRKVNNPFGGGFEDSQRRLFEAFYKGENYPTFEEGYRNVVLCEKVYESAMNDGEWMDV